ncbi:MAG: Asp-tRNA(Asn)/Glu-tRNA(Gln) amidotransferase subunit GatB [Elusimicrobia bacterium]|nr:Asp-tRNA(Asn)/Glu-tRNA(Gln) amidotransferase subunit GatB [Elusimicrobiota bacterium]
MTITYETVIGLEVHAQINTKSKVFCECSTEFGAEPNANTCHICTAQPGALPILNKAAVEAVVRTGLALNFTINSVCMFSRKQYFYPDISKNYQITQFEPPLCSKGRLDIISDGKTKNINITRIHLEEDAGKLVHDIGACKLDYSLVDLNRAGIGLMEIVSEPEMNSPEEAYQYLSELKNALEYLGTCECSMEEGRLRCDANVSIRPAGQKEFGTRVEIKNMNSLSGVREAITYEVERQKEILNSGGTLVQETRLWDTEERVTKSMRSKESAADYRYFPEPDLAPFNLSQNFIDDIAKTLPELPQAKKLRFITDLGLSDYDAQVLTASKPVSDFYETALSGTGIQADKVAKPVANWVTTELLGKLNAAGLEIQASPVAPENLGKLVGLVVNGTISGKIAKGVFEEMFTSGKCPEVIIKEKGLVQISDEGAIAELCKQAIESMPKAVEQYKAGKTAAIGAIVGAVMKLSKGQANPQAVNKILADLLK